MSMFCFQCQEAAKGTGCTIKGVCGKTDDVANLQDCLMYVLKGLSWFKQKTRSLNDGPDDTDRFIISALFSTITNANFDRQAIIKYIRKGLELKENLKREAENNGLLSDKIPAFATWYTESEEEMENMEESAGVLAEKDEDLRSLKELAVYGIKGMAAYTEHALNLGYEKKEIYHFIEDSLVKTMTETDPGNWTEIVLETGKHGVMAMELLDSAHTGTYGNPVITKVKTGVRNNPGILISGHDLKDLEELLQQTENTGVDVYTHSEMLPGHYYPAFQKYEHFAGNYGNSWWKQKEEFESFNGPILFTTNCIVPPMKKAGYKDHIYTTGSSGLDGAAHIPDREPGKQKDFSSIIEHAKKCAPPVEIENGEITGGFAHHQVLSLADKILEAVNSGSIKKFVVMAGCDGRMNSRNYYTEFADQLPKDNVILTAGCAKYRYNKLELGDIGGIPRVLDAGQCNDSYSLAVIALKLKEVLGLDDINDLPIVYNIAWYEQKAVIVLLALLYLGVKDIHLGPTLPAFLSPNVANVLVDKFGIAKIKSVEEDMEELILS